MSDPSREAVRAYYDAYGETEWERLVVDVPGRVAFAIHRDFLARYVAPGIDVTDLSPVLLDLNAAMVEATDAEASVRSRSLLDVCDTSRYPDGHYDAVLAYGGPLSYAFEDAPGALRGLLRIVRPGGVVVASVMSLLGSWRHFLPAVLDDIRRAGDDAYEELMRTGDLRVLQSGHICRLFRSSEIVAMVAECGGELLAMSASNWSSLSDPQTLAAFQADPRRWASFLAHETSACAEPGAVDGGIHILFAARRPA